MIVNFRYFLVVGLFWFNFYCRTKERRKIYEDLATTKSQLYEIKWSLMSSVIFSLVACLWGLALQTGHTRIYFHFNTYSIWYWPLSLILLMIFHETYFYWTHRLLHITSFYKKFHSVHHASLKPSPWASFSFHPVESVINALALPLISLFLPMHPILILFHLTVMTLTAVTNHLGFEILPSNRMAKAVSKYVISGVHHSEHHRYFKMNFGLFFTFWDRLCETENESFSKHFDDVQKGIKLC